MWFEICGPAQLYAEYRRIASEQAALRRVATLVARAVQEMTRLSGSTCADDRMTPTETQRFAAERMQARVRAAPVDHMPMLTAPSVVVEIVLEPVREVESGRQPLW